VTSVLNFLRILLVDGILALLIKSQPFFVHRRVQQPTAGTILRLKAKTVPTEQNKLGLKPSNLYAT